MSGGVEDKANAGFVEHWEGEYGGRDAPRERPLPHMESVHFECDCIVNGVFVKAGTKVKFAPPSETGTTDQRESAEVSLPVRMGAGIAKAGSQSVEPAMSVKTPVFSPLSDSHPPASPAATPRTDAEAFYINEDGTYDKDPAGPYVPSDFARTLERELDASVEAGARMIEDIDSYKREIADLREQLDRMRVSTVQQELEMEGLKNELAAAYKAIDANWVTHQRVVAAEAARATARQEERQMLIQLVGKLGGRGYTYQAMMGHMRDLPTSRGLKEST